MKIQKRNRQHILFTINNLFYFKLWVDTDRLRNEIEDEVMTCNVIVTFKIHQFSYIKSMKSYLNTCKATIVRDLMHHYYRD